MSTAPSAPCPPPARSSVSWAHEPPAPWAPEARNMKSHVFAMLSKISYPNLPPKGTTFLSMSTAPSAPCRPPARSSVSWAHVLRPLPGLLSPGLASTAPSSLCPPPCRSSVSWAYVHCALNPLPRLCRSPGLTFPTPSAPYLPPARSSVSWAHVHYAFCPSSAPCQVFCLLGLRPLRPQPPVGPLPGLLSPELIGPVSPLPGERGLGRDHPNRKLRKFEIQTHVIQNHVIQTHVIQKRWLSLGRQPVLSNPKP